MRADPAGADRSQIGLLHHHTDTNDLCSHRSITEYRRVAVSVTARPGRVRCMARPSKGPRGAHMSLPHPDVSHKLDDLVAQSGVSSVSQYVSDFLALHVGMPQHVRELNRQLLVATEPRTVTRQYERLMVRPHSDVSQEIRRRRAESGVSSVSQYIADLLALHVGMPEHVRELDRKEVLTLQTSA